MPGRPISIEQFKSRLPKHLRLVDETYVNLTSDATFVDEEYGQFVAQARNVLRGPGHPARSKKGPYPRKPRLSIQDVKSKLPPHITLDETTYVNARTKCRWIDATYGEFWMSPSHVMQGSGHRGYGNRKRQIALATSIEEVKAGLPSHTTIVESSYTSLNRKASFVDEVYGEFTSPPALVLGGRVHRDRAREEGRKVQWTIAEISQKLPNFVIMMEQSYKTIHQDAVFFDVDFGYFKVCPVQFIRGATNGHPARVKKMRIQTCMQKYGVPYPGQSSQVRRKMSRGRSRRFVEYHWKTGEELMCQGTWEVAVVQYLNSRQIDFDWQIPFPLSTGRYYFCDLYLPADDKYVEIKGWWCNELSKQKWEEFHATHPNSELWMKDKLLELGINVNSKKRAKSLAS